MNSIRMPAVMVNQMAENTGAVVRNFFIAGWKAERNWWMNEASKESWPEQGAAGVKEAQTAW